MAGRRANFQWQTFPNTANTIWATTASNVISFADFGQFTDPGTIRRCIIDAYISTLSIADNVEAQGRIGLIVAPPRMVSVGASAVPAPITSGEQAWLWNRMYAFRQDGDGSTGFNYIPLHLHDDVRGMRKFKENDHLICVVENAIGASVKSVTSIRVLLST